MNESIEELRKLISQSDKITILTGAGISTESGISDFRSPGGIWSQYRTVTIQEFLSSAEKRKYYWKYKADTIPSMLNAKPNAAHMAIGRLERKNKLLMLLTQNIDGLHEEGGVSGEKIVDLHGTNREAICLSCKRIIAIEEVLKRIGNGEEDPRCTDCGGLLKPNTVSFGQNLNPIHLEIAHRVSKECDLFMALGTSLHVQPACSFVEVAYSSGKTVVIINRDPTPYDSLARICISSSLAEILPAVI